MSAWTNRNESHGWTKLASVALLFIAACAPFAHSQAAEQPANTLAPVTQAEDGKGYTLRVTTREVVVEVVVRDHDNHPVNDLTAADFEVYEGSHKEDAALRRISGFRVIDPDAEPQGPGNHAVVLPIGGRCEIRSNVHYEIAFHPASWSSGIHTMRVVTHRKRVSVSFRSEFYVGVTDVVTAPPPQAPEQISAELLKVACYHSETPNSILLGIAKTPSGDRAASRYLVTIGPESLPFAGVDERTHQADLQLGICTFTRGGRILDSWQTSVHKTFDAQSLANALDAGWAAQVDVPRHGKPSVVRVVVREPNTGNMGAVDLVDESTLTKKSASTPDGRQRLTLASADNSKNVPAPEGRQRLTLPPQEENDQEERVGSRMSLGSPVPARGAFCGDVYELPTTTEFLPSDFRKLNAVGSIYTDSFNVPERLLPQGLPGSTPRTAWFGVDYYGEFWVTTPGKYEFVLSADDGADLYIDDRRILNDDGIHPPQTITGSVTLAAGRHTIHLPYFQGPTYVSLVLEVKPPNGILDTFDIRDYQRPTRGLALER